MKEDLYSGTIILLAATTIPVRDGDISFYFGIAIPMLLGILLRVGLQLSDENKRKKWTWFNFMVQMMVTVPVCFVAYHFWVSYKVIENLSIYIFMVALMALYIGSVLDRVSKYSIREFLRKFLQKALAESEREEKI